MKISVNTIPSEYKGVFTSVAGVTVLVRWVRERFTA